MCLRVEWGRRVWAGEEFNFLFIIFLYFLGFIHINAICVCV